MTATETQPRLLDASFASDNVAGVSPEILQALSQVNVDAALPYGADPVTAQLRDVIKETFGARAEILPASGLWGRCGSVFDPDCNGQQNTAPGDNYRFSMEGN